ncbi:Zn-dependent protease with chaperone function [Frankia torreyi]|uniref:Zn-dependent protease with chaperone function n=2 Tax=Frankia TaxID=1854 RepID=A0A0D8BHQ7_9ACTN|nr:MULTISPECIES: M56 family metallopeptidase [Frankia]KJE22967.1 Zn-dependent protease with chaperone function [Frankia torreyi]KQM04196.1 Zn-dependent protease with chaperone function [Frankia sp. CpI1-P]
MVWVPLVVNIVVAMCAPALARRLPYRVKPAALTAGAVIAAAGWVWSLTLLAVSFVDRMPALAHRLGATVGAPPAELPPSSAGAAAVLAVGATAGMLLAAATRIGRDLIRAERLVRRLPPGRVHVVPLGQPDACAIGGVTGGRVVITAGMIDCLDSAEQDAVLAHEHAHLAGGHHWLRMIVACCAAVDPLLRRLPGLVENACERWADEHAARATGQRRVLARALGKVSLATLREAQRHGPGAAGEPRSTPTTCGFDHSGVAERMTALLDGSSGATRVPATVLLATSALAAIMIGSAVHAGTDYLALLR